MKIIIICSVSDYCVYRLLNLVYCSRSLYRYVSQTFAYRWSAGNHLL